MEKSLKDKLDLFTDLNEEERAKVEDKFMPSLAYIDYDELERSLDYLRTQNVYITKAREVKVMTLENFAKKFDILNEVNATDIYSQNPEALMWDALDLFKKIKYCIQTKHEYKNPDGTYKNFLFDTKEWGQEFSQATEEVKVEEPIVSAEVDPLNVTLESPEDVRRYNDVMNASNDLDNIISHYEDVKSNIAGATIEPPLTSEEPDINYPSYVGENHNVDYTRQTMQDELGLNAFDNMTMDTLDSSNNDEFVSFNDLMPDEFMVNSGRGR